MSRHPIQLLVVAELNPDVVVDCPRASITFGQAEHLVDHAVLTLGSSGAITASAAAALGVPTGMVAVVGDDEAGAMATRMLADRGVDTAAVLCRTGRMTGMTVVLSSPDGDRALLTSPGTMADLRTADVVDALAELPDGLRHVHVSSIYLQTGLHDGLPALLDRLRSAGTSVSLDPGWDPAEEWTGVLPLLAHVDHLLPNAREAAAIARRCDPTADSDDPAASAAVLAAQGPTVVVKAGADGAMVADAHGVTRVAAPQVSVLDTTGAGDNFDAGYVSAILDGQDPVSAARRAVACGSIAVQGWGGTGRLATRVEAAELAGQLATSTPYLISTKE